MCGLAYISSVTELLVVCLILDEQLQRVFRPIQTLQMNLADVFNPSSHLHFKRNIVRDPTHFYR